MKISLIQPQSNLYHHLPIDGVNRICEPLGLGYIGAVAKQKGYEVNIIHQIDENDDEIIYNIIDFSPDVVGFSSMTHEINKSLYLAKNLKKINKNVKIAFGGSGATELYEQIGHIPENILDILIIGEGEESFINILRDLERKTQSDPVIYSSRISHLDDLPFPLRETLDMNLYKQYLLSSIPHSEQKFATVINSRGCYYNCYFCLNGSLWNSRKFSRSAENVVDEIKYLKEKYGTNLIWLWDPNPSKKDLSEISNEILKRNIKIKWQSFLKPNEADLSLYELMRDSGYELAIFGIESRFDKRLSSMHKGVTGEEQIKAVEVAKKAGFFVHGTYMIGYPDESKEEFLQSFNSLKEIGLDSTVFFFATPFRNTIFGEDCKRKGIISNENLDYYDLVHPVIKTKLTEEWNNENLLYWCYNNFYDQDWLKNVEKSSHNQSYGEFIEYLKQRHGIKF